MKGSYIRPEISFSAYKSDSGYRHDDNRLLSPNSNSIRNSTMFAIMINFGKQWVFQDRFVFDWFVGFSYGFG